MLSIPLTSAILTVNVPQEGQTYDSRYLTVDLSYETNAMFYYENNAGNWREICRRADTNCEKRLRFNEGANSISFKGIDSSGQSSEVNTVNFIVDSKKPRLSTMSPKSNSIVNESDLFKIKYTEDNVQDVTLFFGNDNLTNSTCESGKNQECYFDPNLEEYDGQTIWYWFSVSDKLQTVESRKTKVIIDTKAPNITNTMTTIQSGDGTAQGKRVEILVDVNEANLEDISYTDSNWCGLAYGKEKTLCTKLSVGRCIKSQRFCSGTHTLTLTARDKAGNEVTKVLDPFTI